MFAMTGISLLLIIIIINFHYSNQKCRITNREQAERMWDIEFLYEYSWFCYVRVYPWQVYIRLIKQQYILSWVCYVYISVVCTVCTNCTVDKTVLLNTLLVNIHSIPYAKWMHKQNVPRQNVPWDKSPKGQNVPMDKTSLRQKRPRDKNVPRDQTSQGDKWGPLSNVCGHLTNPKGPRKKEWPSLSSP